MYIKKTSTNIYLQKIKKFLEKVMVNCSENIYNDLINIYCYVR